VFSSTYPIAHALRTLDSDEHRDDAKAVADRRQLLNVVKGMFC